MCDQILNYTSASLKDDPEAESLSKKSKFKLLRGLIGVAALATIMPASVDAADQPGLADYQPQERISGTLRSRGDDQMAKLLKLWQAGFRRHHPEVRFDDTLKGNDSAVYGLEMRTADMALMGRPINPYERYGTYERSWTYPVEIEVATGGVKDSAKSAAYAIVVHKDNPLAKLTLKELDGIFGAQRLGGWKALSWDESSARPASENIRTWGQLGVKGAWADKPIHVYGPPLLGSGSITFFQSRVLAGGAMWNEDLREYDDRTELLAALAQDPYGIAYTDLTEFGKAGSSIKPLALAENAAGPYVQRQAKSVADRSYALARPVTLVFTIDNPKSELAVPRVDPKVREFLRYILSKQGQADVAREGAYLPLNAALVAQQMMKLNATGVPPEMLLLKD